MTIEQIIETIISEFFGERTEVREEDIYSYLESKGFTQDEIQDIFSKMVNNGYSHLTVPDYDKELHGVFIKKPDGPVPLPKDQNPRRK